MKKYTYLIPLLLVGVFASGAAAYAIQYGLDDTSSICTPGNMFHGNQKGHMNEQRSAIQTALENNDYSSFVEIMQSRPYASPVTEEEFNTLREVHQLRVEGHFQEAQNLLDEAGIQRPQRIGRR